MTSNPMHSKYFKKSVVLFFLILSLSARKGYGETSPSGFASILKGNSWHIFPVPIFKTLPGEGQTYGVLAAITAANNLHELKAIIAPAETYNKVTGVSTFVAGFLYPSYDSVLYFFGELAHHFTREGTLRYSHFPKSKGSFIYEGEFSYLQYPFERFFGFGAKTSTTTETNFVSEVFTGHEKIGYRFTPSITGIYTFRVDSWQLHSKAIPELADTLTTFAGNPEVVSSTNLTNRLEFQYDTHPDPNFSETGEFLNFAYLASLQSLGSAFTFHGYDLHAKLTRSFRGGRFTSVVFAQLEQRFGTSIPFYLQSSLGGLRTLRAFIDRRFTARHRFSLDFEERIEVFQKRIFDTEVALSLDPFFSLGQVFDHFSDINTPQIQPVGGFGIRMKAKPSVVGRLDIGFGREGMETYATIDYPF